MLVLAQTNANAGTLLLTGDTWTYGAVFSSGTSLELDNTGNRPVKGTLAADYSSRQIMWSKGYEIRLNENMEVMSGYIAAGKQLIHSLELKPLTEASVHENGQLRAFSIGSIGMIGGGKYTVAADSFIVTYNNGSVRGAKLLNDFDFQCPGSGKSFQFYKGEVSFYPDPLGKTANQLGVGAVRTARLRRDHVNNGETIPANSIITLNERGDVIGIICVTQFFFKRISLPSGGVIELMPSGIFSVSADQDVMINGKTYPSFKQVFVDLNGQVISTAPK